MTNVSPTSANLRATINPGELVTGYHFEYTTEADYLQNGVRQRDEGAGRAGSDDQRRQRSRWQSSSTRARSKKTPPYRFRRRRHKQRRNRRRPGPIAADGPSGCDLLACPTAAPGRWSPRPKKTAARSRASAATSVAAYSRPRPRETKSPTPRPPPSANAQGSPGASQYVSKRAASAWLTENVTQPMISGSYPESPTSGVPFQLFSEDLGIGLVSNGRRCRTSGSSACPVENPPLPGSEAPEGFRNYYLRNADGGYQGGLTEDDISSLALDSDQFELGFAGATPDLAAHRPLDLRGAGPDGHRSPGQRRRMRSGRAEPLREVRAPNCRPDQRHARAPSSPPRAGRSPPTAHASTGPTARNLHLRDGAVDKQVDTTVGGGGTFETASADGSIAYFSKAGHLYRYRTSGGPVEDLVPAGNLEGVLGASEDGAYVYYLTATGLHLEHERGQHSDRLRAPTKRASRRRPGRQGSAPTAATSPSSPRPPTPPSTTTGTSNPENRSPRSTSSTLPTAPIRRASSVPRATPSGERPIGGASIPGRVRTAPGPGAARLQAAGTDRRLQTPLLREHSTRSSAQDTNNDRDVYEWEAQGVGSCTRPGGCVALISNGRGVSASFVDASSRRLRRLLPDRDLAGLLRSRRQSTSTTPVSAAGFREPRNRDPLLRRRLPAAAPRTRRPDARHPATEEVRQPAASRAEKAAQVQEGPGQDASASARKEKPQRKHRRHR